VQAAARCLIAQIYTTMKHLTTLEKSAHDLKKSVAVPALTCLATCKTAYGLKTLLYIRAWLDANCIW